MCIFVFCFECVVQKYMSYHCHEQCQDNSWSHVVPFPHQRCPNRLLGARGFTKNDKRHATVPKPPNIHVKLHPLPLERQSLQTHAQWPRLALPLAVGIYVCCWVRQRLPNRRAKNAVRVACREEPQNLGVSSLLAWRRALVWFVCLCRKGVEVYGKYVVARAGQGKLSYLLGCFRGSADRCVYCC